MERSGHPAKNCSYLSSTVLNRDSSLRGSEGISFHMRLWASYIFVFSGRAPSSPPGIVMQSELHARSLSPENSAVWCNLFCHMMQHIYNVFRIIFISSCRRLHTFSHLDCMEICLAAAVIIFLTLSWRFRVLAHCSDCPVFFWKAETDMGVAFLSLGLGNWFITCILCLTMSWPLFEDTLGIPLGLRNPLRSKVLLFALGLQICSFGSHSSVLYKKLLRTSVSLDFYLLSTV